MQRNKKEKEKIKIIKMNNKCYLSFNKKTFNLSNLKIN